jgi:hypothetical protein
LEFFSNPNVLIKFWQKLAVSLCRKRQFSANFLWRKYFLKTITLVPGGMNLFEKIETMAAVVAVVDILTVTFY